MGKTSNKTFPYITNNKNNSQKDPGIDNKFLAQT